MERGSSSQVYDPADEKTKAADCGEKTPGRR
jgi:hypothetical protein